MISYSRFGALLSEVSGFRKGPEAQDEKKRRIRLMNIVAYFGVVLTLLYQIHHVPLGWYRLITWNLIVAGMYLAISFMNRMGYHRSAPVIFFFLLTVQLSVSSGVFMGAASGVHYFLLFIPPLSILIISRRDIAWNLAVIVLGIAAFFIVEYVSLAEPFYRDAPAFHLRIMHIVSTGGALFISTICVLVFYYDLEMTKEKLACAHERSETLLLNILPAPIAERLKDCPDTIADLFAGASVLFADIVGFTRMISDMPPLQVVSLLNRYFSAYDDLVTRHGLEKIKTIGDAYMVASGIPEQRDDHAEAIVNMAIDMLKITKVMNRELNREVTLRIGINSGQVIAGVIGKKKFIYDLWGDAVNTASRMESHGLPGRIQVSESTYNILKDRYTFEYRGLVQVKGKGEMPTYLLKAQDI